MNCAAAKQMLDAWVDSELDAASRTELARHLEGCVPCASLRRERDALRARLHAELPYYQAPGKLRRAVRLAVAAASGEPARAPRRPSWLQAAVFAGLAALFGALAGYWTGRPAQDESSLAEQVVASHVASLTDARRLTEVTSADRHVVKPWFQGRVDIAPVVRDLSSHGFVLVGGRVDHVGDRQTAATVYRLRNHYISLFAWRSSVGTDAVTKLASSRGFNVATWAERGLGFAVVSDVGTPDLESFAKLVRGAN